MARSFSNAKLVSAYVLDRVSAVVRRGYAAAASGGGRSGGGSVMMKKAGEVSRKETSWVPDPVTGYYRPENIGKEMDAADLREILLKRKIRRN